MCRFTRAQFVHGCRSLKGADSIKAIQARLQEATADLLTRPDAFKDLYRYTYHFGLASSSQSISTPSASGNGTGAAMAVSGFLPRNLPIGRYSELSSHRCEYLIKKIIFQNSLECI